MLGTANVYYIWYGNWARQHRDDDPHRPRSATSAARRTSTSTRPTTTASNTHVTQRRSATPARPTDNYSQARRSPTRRSRPSSPTRSSAATPAQGHQRRLLRAHLGRRERVERLLHAVLRLAHARHDRRHATSSTPSSATPIAARSSCAAQTTSPNGNAGADGMASIIAHELRRGDHRSRPQRLVRLAAARRTPTSARGRSARRRRRRTAASTT